MSRLGPTPQILALAALAVVAGSCAPAPPAGAPAALPELADRTAGPPQRCVTADAARSLRIIDERTVLYGSGRTVWVNRLRSDCPGADGMDILVTEATGAQYCSGDPVRLLDPVARIPGPICVLGDFVPYRR